MAIGTHKILPLRVYVADDSHGTGQLIPSLHQTTMTTIINTFDDATIDSFHGKYRFLSNFWPARIIYNERSYPTTEHAYQAAKATNSEDHNYIAEAKTPAATKKAGRHIEVREDWDQVKDQVMLDVVRLKFQIPELREALIETKDAELIEGNTWGDVYWGVCGGVGQNKLGKILMQVRHEIEQTL